MIVAYLAPEIPALSATFVYNEIFQLEKQGMDIIPFSVHSNHSQFSTAELLALKDNTYYLYQTPVRTVYLAQLEIFIKKPGNYLKTFFTLLKDVLKTGVFTRLSLGLMYRFFYAGALTKQLINKKCEHIHVHFAHVPTDLAMYASSMADITYSVTAHANDLFQRGYLLREKVERAKFFITISEYNRQFLISKGADGNKITVLHCGVDPDQFSIRQSFIPSNVPKLGVVARLVEKKGIEHLINSVAYLNQYNFPCQLAIVGDGPLLNEHKELADSLALSSQEICFLGAVDHKQIADFVKSLDVFVLPCQKDSSGDMDGIPVVLMEAMLSGVPVISTAVSGIPELVIDNETGLLAETGNAKALADCIQLSINDIDSTQNRVKKAIAKVQMDFSLIKNSLMLYHFFSSK